MQNLQQVILVITWCVWKWLRVPSLYLGRQEMLPFLLLAALLSSVAEARHSSCLGISSNWRPQVSGPCIVLNDHDLSPQDSGPLALSRSLCPSSQPQIWDPCLWRLLAFWDSSHNKGLLLLFTCFSQPLALIQPQPLPALPAFSSTLFPSCPGCLKTYQLHLQLSNSSWLAELTAWPATLSFPASAIWSLPFCGLCCLPALCCPCWCFHSAISWAWTA